MESGKQSESNKLAAEPKTIKMFFDGAGCRPNGEGSGFAWICPDSNEKLVQRVPDLTNNQAEYRGFLAALEHVSSGRVVEFFSDSQLICSQFSGQYRVRDEALQKLLSEIRALIASKSLRVTLNWVPRSRNLAGKLL